MQIGCDSFIIITNSPIEINIKRVFECKQGTERERHTHKAVFWLVKPVRRNPY